MIENGAKISVPGDKKIFGFAIEAKGTANSLRLLADEIEKGLARPQALTLQSVLEVEDFTTHELRIKFALADSTL